jgi:hypothetical protein
VLNIDMQIDEINEVRQQKQAMLHGVEAVLVKNDDLWSGISGQGRGGGGSRFGEGGCSLPQLICAEGPRHGARAGSSCMEAALARC